MEYQQSLLAYESGVAAGGLTTLVLRAHDRAMDTVPIDPPPQITAVDRRNRQIAQASFASAGAGDS